MQASVESADEVDGVIVWVDEGNSVTRLDGIVPGKRTTAVVLRCERLVEQCVRDLERTA